MSYDPGYNSAKHHAPVESTAQDQESREFAEAALQAQADAGMWDDDSGIRPGIHAVRALPGYIAMVSRAKKVDRQIGASGSAHGLAREVLTLDAGLAWLVGDSQMDSAASIDPERSRRWRSEVVPPEVMATEDIRAELGYDLDLYERAQHPVSRAGYARRIEALVKEMDCRVAA